MDDSILIMIPLFGLRYTDTGPGRVSRSSDGRLMWRSSLMHETNRSRMGPRWWSPSMFGRLMYSKSKGWGWTTAQ
jgi:hypothetical protein